MNKYAGRECDVETCDYVAPGGDHPSGLARVEYRIACGDCREFYRESGHWPDEQTTLGAVTGP